MNNSDNNDLWTGDIFSVDPSLPEDEYGNGIFCEWNNQPNEFTNQYYYSYNECSIESVYHEYNSIYSQFKSIMDLARQVLEPDLVQDYQTRLDAYDNNINYLENILSTTGLNQQASCSYLIMNNSNMNYVQQYYDTNDNYYQTNDQQWNISDAHLNESTIDFDLNGTLPVEYVDYNNNDNNKLIQDSCYGDNDHGNTVGYELVTLDTESYEFHSEQSFKTIEESGDCPQLCKLDCDSQTIQSVNPDSSFDVKKKKQKKIYAKKAAESGERRVWYRCGWEGCSFGSYYNGVVKRHSYKRHCGEVRIAQSESDAMHRFKCDWPGCDVSLVAYHKLVEHKRRHTGEKPFGCKWKACQYSTGRLYSLIIHERVHKAEHLQ